MNKLIPILILSASLCACTSMQESRRYGDLARSNSFSYYFPSSSNTLSFATLEEASDFVNAAEIKLGTVANKRPAKGLAAKLIGPAVKGDKPVVVSYFLMASSLDKSIDLSDKSVPLESKLSDAVTVSVVFLAFYEDHGVSISSFYLAEGYEFRNNSQFPSFQFNNNEYKADYPIGWGSANAFNYLKEEAVPKE
jgi:hypothetical protein